jgi:hypothetical protein
LEREKVMSQFHYVVFYDTDTQKWGVEFDTTAYFPDGNIYNHNPYAADEGWQASGDDTPITAALDESLVRLLGYLVDTWPAPGVVTA